MHCLSTYVRIITSQCLERKFGQNDQLLLRRVSGAKSLRPFGAPEWSIFYLKDVRGPASRIWFLGTRSVAAENLGSLGGLTADPWAKRDGPPKMPQKINMPNERRPQASLLFRSYFFSGPPPAPTLHMWYIGVSTHMWYQGLVVIYHGSRAGDVKSFKMSTNGTHARCTGLRPHLLFRSYFFSGPLQAPTMHMWYVGVSTHMWYQSVVIIYHGLRSGDVKSFTFSQNQTHARLTKFNMADIGVGHGHWPYIRHGNSPLPPLKLQEIMKSTDFTCAGSMLQLTFLLSLRETTTWESRAERISRHRRSLIIHQHVWGKAVHLFAW